MTELTATVVIESLLRATADDATPIIRRLARNQARVFLDSRAGDAGEGMARHLLDALNDSEELMNGDIVLTADHAKQLNADVDAWEAAEPFSPEDAWDELVNADDRTSPEEYPDMCLITRDELIDFMERANPAPAVDAQEEAEHIRQTEMQEIADGAYGDGPATRGAARDYLARAVDAVPAGEVEQHAAARLAVMADYGRIDAAYGDFSHPAATMIDDVRKLLAALSHGEGR